MIGISVEGATETDLDAIWEKATGRFGLGTRIHARFKDIGDT